MRLILILTLLLLTGCKASSYSSVYTTPKVFILVNTNITCGSAGNMNDCGLTLFDCGNKGEFVEGGPTIYCATNVVELDR